jgi:hypothetical protein
MRCKTKKENLTGLNISLDNREAGINKSATLLDFRGDLSGF